MGDRLSSTVTVSKIDIKRVNSNKKELLFYFKLSVELLLRPRIFNTKRS